MEPHFRRRADGTLNLSDSLEAVKVKEVNKGKPWMRPLSPDVVEDKARKALTGQRGDPLNRKHLLGFFDIQFGVFRGQTFKWLVENALGYAAYLVAAMKRDPTGSKDSKDHAHNKSCFREYMELFPSGRIAIEMKEEQYAAKTPHSCPPRSHQPPGMLLLPPRTLPPPSSSLHPPNVLPLLSMPPPLLSAHSWLGNCLSMKA